MDAQISPSNCSLSLARLTSFSVFFNMQGTAPTWGMLCPRLSIVPPPPLPPSFPSLNPRGHCWWLVAILHETFLFLWNTSRIYGEGWQRNRIMFVLEMGSERENKYRHKTFWTLTTTIGWFQSWTIPFFLSNLTQLLTENLSLYGFSLVVLVS